jgi:hypothetical protein
MQSAVITAKADCDFNIVATAVPATCFNNGQIIVKVVGADTSLLDLTTAEYSIQSVNTTFQTEFARWTDGTYSGVAPGTYVVKMKVYCPLSDRWETRSSSSNVIVSGNYEPIENVSFLNGRNALNCAPKSRRSVA